MSTTVIIGSVNRSVPSVGETGWGQTLSDYLIEISTKCLAVKGGTYTLLAEMNLSGSYGIKTPYLKSQGTNIGSTGIVRLANTESIVWRNAGNSADKALKVNASDRLEYDGVNVPTISSTDTLTNKSIDADTNTITNIENADIKAGAAIDATKIGTGVVSNTEFAYLDGVNAAIQNQLDNKQPLDSDLTAVAGLSSTGLIARTGSGTASTRTVTGTANRISVTNGDGVSGDPTLDIGSDVVTLAGAQAITNKSMVSSGASTDSLNIPTGTTAQRPGSPATGTIRHNSSTNEFEGYTASAWQSIGGGVNEQPVKNYYKSYAQSTIAPGTLSTLAAYNSNIALTGSGLAITSAFYADATSGAAALTQDTNSVVRGANSYLSALSGATATGRLTAFQFPAFALDPADLGKPVSVGFDLSSSLADGDWDIVMVRYTVSGATGTYAETIPIAGNASAATDVGAKLPSGKVKFQGFFIAGSTATDVYALRARRLVGSQQIYMDSLYVGPQSVTQGAAVTDWVQWTPTFTGFGTVTTDKMFWRRVGDSIEIAGNFTTGTVSGANATFTLPNSLVNDSKKRSAVTNPRAGKWYRNNGTATTRKTGNILTDSSGSNLVYFGSDDYTTAVSPASGLLGNAVAGNTEILWVDNCVIPISGWSSNITMVDRAVEEYISTTSITSPSIVRGISGAALPTSTPASTYEEGSLGAQPFSTPMQATDSFVIEINRGGNTQWLPLNAAAGVENLRFDGTNYIGIGVYYTSGAVYIFRGKYATGASTTWASVAANTTYRIRKVSGGAAVGCPISARNIVGDTTGTTVPAGYVGETLTQTSSGATFTTSTANILSQAVTAGRYMVNANASYSSSTSNSYIEISVTPTTGGSGTFGDNRMQGPVSGSGTLVGFVAVTGYVMDFAAAGTIYLTGKVSTGTATGGVGCKLSITRIG